MAMDKTTVATTNTPMSRMTATQQLTIAQFNELEAAIQSNHQDFQRVSNQMDQMDERINRHYAGKRNHNLPDQHTPGTNHALQRDIHTTISDYAKPDIANACTTCHNS
jgi:hypothetical protein